MSSFEQKLKQWSAGLKLPDTSTTLNEIRQCLSRQSKDIGIQVLHIFSKVVLPLYCSGENRADDGALLEMVTYLWTFSHQGPFKHFITQFYSAIRGMPTTKVSCARINALTPLLSDPNLEVTDLHQVYTSINSIIFFIFYTAKEQMDQELSKVLFKSVADILKHQRTVSLSSFLETFAAWFDKKTQTLLVMLTVDAVRTQKLLESVAPLLARRDEELPVKFRDRFWSIVEVLVKFETKFKGTDLVQTVVGGVAQGALFYNDQTATASVLLFHEVLLFKKQPLADKSFSQLTKAVNKFLKNVGNSEFPAEVIILAVGQLYEKLHKSNPVVSEPVCSEFMATLDRLVRWVHENWVPSVQPGLNWSICNTCSQQKDHILLQMSATIALTPIQPHFLGHTISERLFDPFLSILKINVLAMDRLACVLATRLKDFWLNTWWQLARTYKPAKRGMRAQFLELIGLVREKRSTYAQKDVSDLALLRVYELVYNAEACTDLPADDPTWDRTVDLMCTEAVLTERKYAQRAVYCVLGLQKRNPRFQGMNLHQLLERPEFHDFGVDGRSGLDRYAAIELQMWVTYAHYPDQAATLIDLFDYVWQDRPEAAVSLVKLLQYFDEAQFQRLAPARIARLKQMSASAAPANTEDAFKVALNLGYLNYNLYVAENELVKQAGRTANPTDKAVLKKELLPFIDQINMDQECKVLRLLDEALAHFTAMTRLLAANEQLFELVVSPSKLLRCLDNLSLFYQLRYVEDKGVQAKCLVYVVAKRRAHLNAQLSCACLFVDHPRLYEAVVASALGFKMPRTVRAFLDAHKDLTDAVHHQQPDLSKTTHAVELASKLAVYHAATGAHDRVERLVICGRDLIQRHESNADAKSHVWYMKVHFYYALYLITFKHRMRWLASLHAAVPFVLEMFKNMGDPPIQDYLTQPTVFMQTMIPELLEFAATQKSVTETENSYLNMLIKYAIRQGYGLRTAQLFAMSSKLALDREGMDECEVKLAYVDKVLMFYTNANLSEKSNYSVNEMAPSAIPIATSPLLDEVFTAIEPIRRDSGAPNGREFLSPITGANKQQPLRQMITTQQPQRRLSKYIIDHADTCECGFCRYPQFRLVSFQTGCIYTRLLHMTGAHEISGKLYAKYFKCWSAIREQVQTHRIMSATLAEAFGVFSAQFMVYYSQALVQSQRLDEAKAKLELAHRISRADVQARNEGFRQEVKCQSENVRLMLEATAAGQDEKPTFVAQPYEDFLKRTRQYKTPAKSQLLSIKQLSKSTVKKPPARDSFSFLISAEVGTSSQVTASDIFNDSSCVPERYKNKRIVAKTPKATTSSAKTPKATPSTAKTPVTVLRKKLESASAKPASPTTKLTKAKVHAETAKKLQFVDEAKVSPSDEAKSVKKSDKPATPVTLRKLTKPKSHAETAKKLKFIDEAKISPLDGAKEVKNSDQPATPVTVRKLPAKKLQLVDEAPSNESKSVKKSSKPASPVTIRKLTKTKTPAESAKKLQFVDEAKGSPLNEVNSAKRSAKPAPVSARKLTKPKVYAETAKKLQFVDEEKEETPKTAPQKSKGILAVALEKKRLEIEAKKSQARTPIATPIIEVSDDEVVEASPEVVTKTPRRRLAQIPVIILDDSVDDTKENTKPAVNRKPRAKKTAKIAEDTPKRPASTRARK